MNLIGYTLIFGFNLAFRIPYTITYIHIHTHTNTYIHTLIYIYNVSQIFTGCKQKSPKVIIMKHFAILNKVQPDTKP